MVYRQPADELARERTPEVPGGPLAHLDADGKRGAAGARGTDGADGRSRGEDGDHGRAGGVPSSGGPGGDIRVVLEAVPGRDHLARVRGSVTGGRGDTLVHEEIDFGRAGELVVVARGGRGGHGGDGGDGGDGARGRSGQDASSTTSGTQGGRGGDGGNAGSGADGAPGGPGGRILLRVAEADTHLLMLVAPDVSGGRGGKPGSNGAVGRGGPGGPGGSSHAWTTHESYADGSGRTHTRSKHHSNPGGSHGPAGRDGRAARAVPQPGPSGASGRFTIEVDRGPRGVARYDRRYDVRLVSFRHRNENDDGIYEPEEKVLVTHVEVENVGGMPTPEHHDVVVGLADSGWIAPADTRLRLPRGLPPGTRHVFTGEPLALTLRLYRPQASSEPLAENETIHFFADFPDVQRRFEGFESHASPELGRLIVRFPVVGSPLTSLFSLAPGQAARLRWSVTNVSGKDYGSASELGRAVSVYLGLAREPGLGAKELHFFDDRGEHVPFDVGFRREVPLLKAGETVTFEGTVAVAEGASTYASGRLFVATELGRIDAPLEVRPIQYRELTLRVGRPFDARDADVLFVTNNRTTEDELRAWEELASRHRLTTAVWDASLEGGVSVFADVAAGARRYGLVVILTSRMDTAAGVQRTSALVDRPTTLALAAAGVHLTYVGAPPELADLVVPADDVAPGTALAADAERADLVAACEAAVIGGPGVSLEVRATYAWPWSTPDELQLEGRAVALAKRLEARFPARRYVVVPRYAPELVRRVGWVRVFSLGQLHVRRSLDPARRALTGSMREDGAELASDLRLLEALPFSAKLRLLADAAPSPASINDAEARCSDPRVAAPLRDLLAEQQLVAHDRWRADPAELAGALPMLEELAREGFAGALPGLDNGAAMARLVELVAWLELAAGDHARLWELAPPLRWLRRRAQLRRHVQQRLDALVLRAAGSKEAAKLVRTAVTARRRRLVSAWKTRARTDPGARRAAAFTLDLLDEGAKNDPLASDAAHLPRGERVIDAVQVAALAAAERSREAGAAHVSAGARQARGALLRDESCADLLARAGVVVPQVRVATADAHEPEVEEEPIATGEDLRALLRR
ncbi:MAG: hypothetical protein JWP97_6788 [Labilithrix sp.]|nr:hypothetical protein [Labilithrix sp.]